MYVISNNFVDIYGELDFLGNLTFQQNKIFLHKILLILVLEILLFAYWILIIKCTHGEVICLES